MYKLEKGSVNLSVIQGFKPRTHKLNILRHCTNMVYFIIHFRFYFLKTFRLLAEKKKLLEQKICFINVNRMIQSDTIGFKNVPTIVLPVYGPYYRYHFEACVRILKKSICYVKYLLFLLYYIIFFNFAFVMLYML